ncbi:hypothetical protein GHT06_008698 [Daphnia sinensis]|uniref:Chromo domain-containing protein n=1 Tax=Daphnia sinensis TaxID=1820382 RepID=A0AAD5L2Q5_9CRUS|nr:hypothetical protein GHT06_008698 [Daphnia sinensis]
MAQEDPEYEVEEVLDRDELPNEQGLLRVWYLITFKGYPHTENRWLPATMTKCKALEERQKYYNNE